MTKGKMAARALLPLLAAGLVLAGCGSSGKSSSSSSTSGGTASGGSSGSAQSTGAPIKVGLLVNLSGPLAATYTPVKAGVQSFVSYYNAHGGLYGHHLSLTVYDDASSATQVLANARLAVSNGDQVLVGQEYLLASAVPYLKSQQEPFFGFGLTPSFFGTDKTNFFSFVGNLITGASNALQKYAIQDLHYTNISLVSDSVPANSETIPPLKQMILQLGGTVPYVNSSVDDTSSASLLALAEKLKSTPTQMVYTNFLGYAAAQLQADLSQIGSHIVVANGIIGFDPQVPKQFGSAANGLISTMLASAWVDSSVPGVQVYKAAMEQYSPGEFQNQQAIYGWDAMVEMGGALQLLGSKSPTKANINAAANSLHNFTGDGMLQPVSFPAFHTQPALCVNLGQLKSGTWSTITGTASDPFFCGDKFSG